jgi:hypothetical protein
MTFMYERQRFHKTALTETQSGKMQEAVTKAEHTIQQRLADCPAPIMLRGQCSSDRRSPAVRPNCPFRWFSVRLGLFLAIGKPEHLCGSDRRSLESGHPQRFLAFLYKVNS